VPALGIYPTLESLAAQGVLVLLLVAALVWTFGIEPRRLRVTRVWLPAPSPSPAARAPPPSLAGDEDDVELLRSLERVEADLAEIRAEIERMKHRVSDPATLPRRES
jgi:hypothetical protein